VLFELVDPRDIHLMLQIFEKDLHLLSVGQRVKAFTNNNSDKKIDAEIILVSKTLDENRMAEIHCHFKNYDASLTPGMFMNGEEEMGSHIALTVPEDAVFRWEKKF
jgi:cobalt-zinc-cadmium efflux system membrane fusion protein